MNEWIIFIFINLVIFNLYFHFSQLIKMEKPINYFDDDDFWVMNFYGFKFNLSQGYFDEVSNKSFLNKFYENKETYDEKFEYFIFETLLTIFLYFLCLCECIIPIFILFIILLLYFFSNWNQLKFNIFNEKFFPLNHERILFIKFIIESFLLIITFIMLISVFKGKCCNCLCFKKKKKKYMNIK